VVWSDGSTTSAGGGSTAPAASVNIVVDRVEPNGLSCHARKAAGRNPRVPLTVGREWRLAAMTAPGPCLHRVDESNEAS
jgi:hypothetical protein